MGETAGVVGEDFIRDGITAAISLEGEGILEGFGGSSVENN